MDKIEEVLAAIRQLNQRMAAFEAQTERMANDIQNGFSAMGQKLTVLELQVGKMAQKLLAPGELRDLGIEKPERPTKAKSARNSGGNHVPMVAKGLER